MTDRDPEIVVDLVLDPVTVVQEKENVKGKDIMEDVNVAEENVNVAELLGLEIPKEDHQEIDRKLIPTISIFLLTQVFKDLLYFTEAAETENVNAVVDPSTQDLVVEAVVVAIAEVVVGQMNVMGNIKAAGKRKN